MIEIALQKFYFNTKQQKITKKGGFRKSKKLTKYRIQKTFLFQCNLGMTKARNTLVHR